MNGNDTNDTIRYQLEIIDSSVQGVTGHHTVQARIIATIGDGSVATGIPETYGIDSPVLQSTYNGDVGKWIGKIAGDMLAKHQRREMIQMELIQFKGKKIDIPFGH